MRVGPYDTLEELARGGAGVVYRARGPDGREVALKLLKSWRSEDRGALRRFEAEVRALTRLRHPHVVALIDAGVHEGVPWMALELIAGQTLAQRLEGGPLPLPEALAIVTQLAQALVHVHAHGLLHRDLTPQNVLLQGDVALLTDFGLTRDEADQGRSRVTQSGVFLGTPGYWPPEQALGQRDAIDARSDVYGWGALLYVCLTGYPPQRLDSLHAAFDIRRPPSPRAVRPEVPQPLEQLCLRCLEPDPARRPASAAALLAALEGKPARARRPAGVALGLGLAVGLGVAFALGGRAWSDAQRSALLQEVADAERLLEQGELDEAERRLAAAVDRAPDSAAAWTGRGWVHAKREDYPRAIADLSRALELEPDRPDALARRGVVLQLLGDQTAALADLERAVALAPAPPVVRYNLAVVLHRLGRQEEALAIYEGCQEVPDARLMRGCCLFDLERYEEAEACLRDALELEATDLTTWTNLGRVLERLGRPEDALEVYARASARFPEAPLPHALRGDVHLRADRWEDALAAYDLALAGEAADPDAFRNRAVCLLKLGRPEEARRALRSLVRSFPDDPRNWSDLGNVEFALRSYGAAETSFARALDLDPQRVPALVGAARVRGMAEDHAQALRHLEHALQLEPSSGEVSAYLGIALAELGRYAEALEAFDRALGLSLPEGMVPQLRARRTRVLRQLEARGR